MQVQHVFGTRAFVQVVHVLGDDLNVHAVLPCGELVMARVRLGFPHGFSPLVVKPGDQLRVAIPCRWRGHVFDPVAFPQPACTTEGRNAAFCTHASAGQHHQMFGDVHRSKLRKRPQVFGLSLTSMSQRHFIIYDLEATCWRSRAPKRVEVIEIGAVKVNESLDIVSEFCLFVKPTLHPQISKFCTQLTSITQSDVDRAPFFDEAIEAFEDWIDPKVSRAVLMSWGEFDKRQLLSDGDLHDIDLPWLRYHACLQHHYSKWKGSKNQIGLKTAMELEGLSYSGTQHRAIEDARNMARLFQVIATPMELVNPE